MVECSSIRLAFALAGPVSANAQVYRGGEQAARVQSLDEHDEAIAFAGALAAINARITPLKVDAAFHGASSLAKPGIPPVNVPFDIASRAISPSVVRAEHTRGAYTAKSVAMLSMTPSGAQPSPAEVWFLIRRGCQWSEPT